MSAAAVTARVPLGAVLRVPGFVWLFGASMVGRVPGAALGLVLVLRTRELTGSFAAGGLVAGINALAVGVTAPVLGRIVDRRGQVPVLAGCAVLTAAGLLVLGLLPRGAGLAAAAACAVAAGAGFPPLGACLRTALPALLPDRERRHPAFALESAATELTYVAGPLLVAAGVAVGGAGTAAIACAALTLLGVAGFTAHPAARAFQPVTAGERAHGGALRSPGVRTLVLVFGLVGTTFGAIEVAVPAAADAGVAGALLALWGAGSLTGGLIVARGAAPADTARRLRQLLAALAAGHLLLIPATGPIALAALLPVAGLAIAPTFACTFALVEDLAPHGTLTETYTWLTTGIGAGIAVGAALAGLLAQASGASAAFALAAAAAAAGAVLAAVSRLGPAR
jgi:predicted MFS family arabinose efflux permease